MLFSHIENMFGISPTGINNPVLNDIRYATVESSIHHMMLDSLRFRPSQKKPHLPPSVDGEANQLDWFKFHVFLSFNVYTFFHPATAKEVQ